MLKKGLRMQAFFGVDRSGWAFQVWINKFKWARCGFSVIRLYG
jgi:hypothetical protein